MAEEEKKNQEDPEKKKEDASQEQNPIDEDASEELQAFVQSMMEEYENRKPKVKYIILGHRIHKNRCMDLLLQLLVTFIPAIILFGIPFPNVMLSEKWYIIPVVVLDCILEYVLNMIAYKLCPKAMLFSFGIIAYGLSLFVFYSISVTPFLSFLGFGWLMIFVLILDLIRFSLKYALKNFMMKHSRMGGSHR